MQTVCVCEQHQNAKLLVAALPEQFNYKNLLSELVCNLNEKNCMLHFCSQCPGRPQLQKALEKILDGNNFDVDDSIKCKQWIHTDGTKLIDMQLLVSEFIDMFLEKFDLLCRHYFIANAQSAFFPSAKKTLPSDTVIILLDFTENYKCLVQDAVQGYHWENSQATLHPFCCYYKEKRFLNA